MADKGAIQERRKEQRWRWTLQVRLEWKGGAATAFCTDLSSLGMFLETKAEVPPGTDAQLTFKVSLKENLVAVVANGKIIRCVTAEQAAATRGRRGLGVTFVSFTTGKKQLVRALNLAREGGPTGTGRKEQRSSPRMNIGLSVRWGLEDPPSREGRLINLASGGLLVATEKAPSVGARIYLAFFLPEDGKQRKVKAIARVSRVDDESVDTTAGMAITFETSSMGDTLMAVLKERLAEERIKPGLLQQDLATAAGTISAAARGMDVPRIRLGGKYHVFRWKWVIGWFLAALALYVAAYFALGAGVLN